MTKKDALQVKATRPMLCPVCQRAGKRSHVNKEGVAFSEAVAVSHFDPDGKFILGVWETAQPFICSRGHRWIEFERSNAPEPDFILEEGVTWL